MPNRQSVLIFACAAFICAVAFAACEFPRQAEIRSELPTARVVGVSDGDSLIVLIDGVEQRMRLASIDAPEMNQPFGKQSKRHLSDLVYKRDISYRVMDRDRYHRYVVIAWIGETELNLQQIRAGYAWFYRRHRDQLDPGRQRLYELAEDQAKSEGLGLWRDKEGAIPPWRYRDFKTNEQWKNNTKN